MNKVIAGRFVNKRLSPVQGILHIHLKWGKRLPLTPDIIAYIQIIGKASMPKVSSGFLRGSLAKTIPSRTLWLASVLSAKHKTTYTVKITYRDGSSSIVLLNNYTTAVIASNNAVK